MADANLKLDVKLTGLERPRVALAVLGQLECLEAHHGPEELDRRRLALWLRLMRAELRGAQRALDLSAVRSVLGHLRRLAALAVGAMEAQDRQGIPTPTRAEEEAHAEGRAEAAARWPAKVQDQPKGSAAVRARPARRRRSS